MAKRPEDSVGVQFVLSKVPLVEPRTPSDKVPLVEPHTHEIHCTCVCAQVGLLALLLMFVAPNFVYMLLLQLQRRRMVQARELAMVSYGDGSNLRRSSPHPFCYAALGDDDSDYVAKPGGGSAQGWTVVDSSGVRRRYPPLQQPPIAGNTVKLV